MLNIFFPLIPPIPINLGSIDERKKSRFETYRRIIESLDEKRFYASLNCLKSFTHNISRGLMQTFLEYHDNNEDLNINLEDYKIEPSRI